MHHPTDRITHTTAFVTPVVEHWLEREIAQWVHPMKDRSDDPSHHERTLLPRSYIALRFRGRKAMFHLPTHSTYLILQLYGISIWLRTTRITRKETRCRHFKRILFPKGSEGSFICIIPPVVKHWLERERSQIIMEENLLSRHAHPSPGMG